MSLLCSHISYTISTKNTMNTNCYLIALFGLVLSLLQASAGSVVSTGNFTNDFFQWNPTHINTSADESSMALKLDKESGAAFESNELYLFGQFDMQIKLIPEDSAGTVVAFYMTSDQPNRDEVDFEFLGNISGQPYTLQTNVFADGFGSREERIYLWFDPTKDFHTYTVFWNLYQILFLVDGIPIRAYKNHADKGVAYPRWQPLNIKVALADSESWPTQGGYQKIDWSKGPFIASFRNHKIDACIWEGNARFCRADSTKNWWNKERFRSPTPAQNRWLKWVRKHYMTYDYCKDKERFKNDIPKECFLPKY